MTSTWRIQHDDLIAWYEAWNRRDWETVEKLLADKVTIRVVALGSTVHGVHDYLRYVRDWAEAFPDGRIKIKHIIGTPHAGDVIAVEYSITGTQQGFWGVFAPSHKKTTLHFCDLLKFEHDRLASCTTYCDFYRPLSELGHVVSVPRLDKGQAA